ncbi:MAG: TetR/AcrR family transcriptional regulator [Burkholderiales bacterium]|nr:TetR/AcrR family transcriptional regulator [Burkholderiales bacterium]
MNNPIRDSAPAPAPAAGTLPGRRPRQERSRQRVENILAIALRLMVEHGAEALAMREIARRAEVQISSIYQYFPSKSAIIRELAQRDLARVRQLLRDAVDTLLAAPKAPPIVAAVDHLVDAYFAHYRDQPEALAVWAGAQSDPSLRELDQDDTRSTAEFLVAPLLRLLGRPKWDGVHALSLLISEMTGAAARLALSLESPLREQLIAQHKAMLVAALESHKARSAHPAS